ncbi:uncharacterized protein LOC118125044 [Hippoglossus stenolepis]|uniref:uncharacterized protein LOC118125044 n=1 Tax=Hippoglossus stenolepis TaxID=195615 RepID=UPI00159C70F3|nr:uncharacterized protein LOC118125044 [Hippoglossus stenolepis]
MNVSRELVTRNSSKPECVCVEGSVVFLSMVDIITFLTGQPVVVTLLWTILTSRKTPDILNFHLALFHNLQYLISLVHLCFLFLVRDEQWKVFNFLLVYAQTGGPMSLGFICFQRYVAVIHPTSYPLLKKHRYREACVATVWLFSLSFAVTNVLGSESIAPVAMAFFKNFPFFVMIAMTCMMVHSTIQTIRMLKKPGPESNKMNPAKRRAINAVRATSAITLCFYFPVTLMAKIQTTCKFACQTAPFSFLLLSAASVVDPLCHLSTLRKLFACCKCEEKPRRS